MLTKAINFVKRIILHEPLVGINEEKSYMKNEEESVITKIKVANNAVELQLEIIERIVEIFKPIRYSKIAIQTIDLFVHEYPNPAALKNILSGPDFESTLRLALENSGIEIADSCIWKHYYQVPPPEATKIDQGLYIWYSHKGNKKPMKFKVTAEIGELLVPSYSLNTDTNDKFNIGRGKSPRLENGRYQKNHIVIKDTDDFDDQNDEAIQFNRFVSRAHAAILSTEHGFELIVYDGGCPQNGNRTRIFRENKPPIEVNNTKITYPLKNLDQIELGKNVLLNFYIEL